MFSIQVQLALDYAVVWISITILIPRVKRNQIEKNKKGASIMLCKHFWCNDYATAWCSRALIIYFSKCLWSDISHFDRPLWMNERRISSPLALLQGKQTEIVMMKFCFSSLPWVRIHIDWILELEDKMADGPALLGSPYCNQEGTKKKRKKKSAAKPYLYFY